MKIDRYNMNLYKGFTLIELLIVIAVIGILASVAYPSYLDSVRKARRTDGIEAVLACSAAMKRQFTVLNTFNGAPPADCAGTSGEGYYNMTVNVTNGGNRFTASATPPGGTSQAADADCLAFTISNTGLQSVSGSSSANPQKCWK